MTREAVLPVDSIDRVAMLARRAPFTPDDAVLLAAVGATAAAARGTASPDAPDPDTASHGAPDPGTALMLAAGAATVRPRAPLGMGRLEMLANAVPEDSRLTVLSFAEGLLAQSHPRQAWELICSVVGARTAVEHALGLDVAAHLGTAHPGSRGWCCPRSLNGSFWPTPRHGPPWPERCTAWTTPGWPGCWRPRRDGHDAGAGPRLGGGRCRR